MIKYSMNLFLEKIKYCLLIGMIFFLPFSLFTQEEVQEPNPFELVHRLDKSEQLAIIQPKGNPFNISKPAESLKKKLKEAEKYGDNNTIVQISRYKGDKDVSRNWLLAFIIPMILFLTLIATLFREKLSSLFKSFTNSNMLNLAYRESIGRTNIHSLFLYILSIISFGFYGLVLSLNDAVNSENFWKAILVALSLSAAYVISKLFLIFFVKTVFPKKKTMDFYLFMYGQYNHLLGLILIPFSIFLAFSPPASTQIITYLSFIFIGFWWIMRIIRGLQIGSRFISINIFRFFAYICTVEIAPIIILFTTLKLILRT